MSASSQTIVSGVPWWDENGQTVNMHGVGVIEDGGRWWLFGEYKSDTTNATPGFSCYSSADLEHWRFERVALPVQPSGILGPERVGERPKVMRCPQTGEYIMLAHSDNLSYSDPVIALATSKTVGGPYTLLGPLLYNGQPLRRWDMGVFQDTDGTGYLLIHHGPIYRLAPDYRSIDRQVADVKGMGESPAMFKHKGTYFLLTSNLTSWERNDNYYFTAPSIAGPWTRRGLFCPEGTLTWNSQSSYVLPLRHGADTTFVYMGDRWSFPHQASAATQVWQPITVSGTQMSIPKYMAAWDALTLADLSPTDIPTTPIFSASRQGERHTATLRISKGKGRIAIYGRADTDGGYARVTVIGPRRDTIHSTLIDFYAKRPDTGLRFLSKPLKRGRYTVTVEATGEGGTWTNKRHDRFGSTGSRVTVTAIKDVRM